MPPRSLTPPPRWAIGVVVGAALTALDVALAGGRLGAVAVSAGLGVGLGGLVALAWALAAALAGRLPRLAGRALYVVIGLAGAVWLVDALGALARLDGPHAGLAFAAIGARLGGGLALAAVLAALQPAPDRPRGLAGARPRLAAAALARSSPPRSRSSTGTSSSAPTPRPTPRSASPRSAASSPRAGCALRRRGPRLRRGLALVAAFAAAAPFVALHHGADRTLAAVRAAPLGALALDALRGLTDVDGDGASNLLGGGDEAPLDGEVIRHPPPPVVAAAPADPWPAALPPAPTRPAPLSVVLITIDTLRPDRMGLYGHTRATTPRLDAFARGAVRFDRAYTPGAWTSLAISSLLRGLPPRALRWTRLAETNRFRLLRDWRHAELAPGERLRLMFGLPIDDPRPPLPEQLARRGMHTIAVVDDGYSRFLSEEMGTDRGFVDFRTVDALPADRRDDAGTTDLALAALRERPADRRFFMWVHYFGPHDPSTRREGAPWYGEGVAEGYDHEIAYADAQVGRLLRVLDNVDEPLAVIVTSDHGELLLERRRLHGIELHPSLVRVPLLLRAPGLAPGASEAVVGLVDVAPTVLALTGTPAPTWMPGVDLRAAARGEVPARILTTDTWRFDRHGRAVYDQVGVLDGRHILVLDQVHNVRQLWSLDDLSHPAENLHGEVMAFDLEAALVDYLARTGGGRVRLFD
ncbi:MAG: sulfatase [Myxococcales bacterium]|nr:sulfatase [Myxococcales bacterium]